MVTERPSVLCWQARNGKTVTDYKSQRAHDGCPVLGLCQAPFSGYCSQMLVPNGEGVCPRVEAEPNKEGAG